MKVGDWEKDLADYKKEFIESQGWNEKQAASYIRDAWVRWRDGRLAILPAKGEAHDSALPVFQFRNSQGWRLPVPLLLHVLDTLRPQGDNLSSGLMPREQVYATIAEQGPPPEGDLLTEQIKPSELKRIIAQQAAGRLADICDRYDSEPEAADDCCPSLANQALNTLAKSVRGELCSLARFCVPAFAV